MEQHRLLEAEFKALVCFAMFVLGLVSGSIWWVFSIFPMAVSFVIARILGDAFVPSLVLCVTTVAYVIWYICWHVFVFYVLGAQNVQLFCIGLMSVGILALPAMVPAWIATLILNLFFAESTPTEP